VLLPLAGDTTQPSYTYSRFIFFNIDRCHFMLWLPVVDQENPHFVILHYPIQCFAAQSQFEVLRARTSRNIWDMNGFVYSKAPKYAKGRKAKRQKVLWKAVARRDPNLSTSKPNLKLQRNQGHPDHVLR
jgi:hypothetical protein